VDGLAYYAGGMASGSAGQREILFEMLRAYPASIVARGRAYAKEGRVTELFRQRDRASAVVVGTERYAVEAERLESGAYSTVCTCRAFQRVTQCKHVAALAFALADLGNAPAGGVGGGVAGEGRGAGAEGVGPTGFDAPLPPILGAVYSSAAFFTRLSLYAGRRLPEGGDRWSPMADWWRMNRRPRDPSTTDLRTTTLAFVPEIEREVATLKAWSPPPHPRPTSAIGALYARLAALYVEVRDQARVRRCAPGPLDSRHPGFELTFDPKRGAFHAVERGSPLLTAPQTLSLVLPLHARHEVGLDPGSSISHGSCDAWELFALHSILLAFHPPVAPAVSAMERDLERPVWDHVLEQLSASAAGAPQGPFEWAFTLTPASGGDAFRLLAHSRRCVVDAKGKPPRWKKQSFEHLLADEESELVALESEIARVALCSGVGVLEALLEPGTAQGHELLRLLSRHPRVSLAVGRTPEPDPAAAPELVIGTVTMRFDRAPGGALQPRFMVDDLTIPVEYLVAVRPGSFRGHVRGRTLYSLHVPVALRTWIAMAYKLGSALVFPAEAVPQVVTMTEGLVARGVVELPREVLGEELRFEPIGALRVEWFPEGHAKVMLFVCPRRGAPMVEAGGRPKILTYEEEGRRVFVERDLGAEEALMASLAGQIEAPVGWMASSLGETHSVADALELALYLDRNPLGLEIEVKRGRPPVVTKTKRVASLLEVRKAGHWLYLGGGLDVAGAKLTMGDVLEAARQALRYVKIVDGVYVELSDEELARLRAVAMAADLAEPEFSPENPLLMDDDADADDEDADGDAAADDLAYDAGYGGDDDSLGDAASTSPWSKPVPGSMVRIHAAFAPLLAEASEVFAETRGLDLQSEVVQRFGARLDDVEVPALDHGTLRPYQREGVAWMLRLASWAPGCVLADDMGLGKTVQTAAVLKARAHLGPQLIVAPASVSSNWMSELRRFVPSLRARWFNETRGLTSANLGPGDIVVVSYGLVRSVKDDVGVESWATVVLDEAQYCKNRVSGRTKTVRKLPAAFWIALTGTPLENHLGELFSVMDLVFPGLLGTVSRFTRRFRRPIEGSPRDLERVAVLGRMIEPFLLRRTRAAVLEELPPREEITELIDLSPLEQKRYLALRKACEDELANRERRRPANLRIMILAALTRLRQAACEYRLVDPTFDGPSTKMTRAVELVTGLAQEGNCSLVFSQFTQYLRRIRDALVAAGLRVAYLDGETPTMDRAAIVAAFQAGEYDVFCVSLLAGGTGLNLTRASYVIHTDPWWNPAAEEQATSRAHRMGQSEPVTVYRLVSRGTIEQAVLELHASKRDLASAVLSGKTVAKTLSPTDLLDLLHFRG